MKFPWRARDGGSGGRYASAQATQLGLEAIQAGTVRLSGGWQRAILAVGSLNFALAGEAERDAIIDRLFHFFTGLPCDVQLLIQSQPDDLAPYRQQLEARAQHLPPRLAAAARDHAAYVQQLEQSRTMLERRVYLVVPAEDPAGTQVELRPWRIRRRWVEDGTTLLKRLTGRCEELTRQLGRCGLGAHRLNDGQLADLFHRCWCRDPFQRQRTLQHLRDFEQLVIRGRRPGALPETAGTPAPGSGAEGATALQRRAPAPRPYQAEGHSYGDG